MSAIVIRLRPHHIEFADGVGLVRRGKAMMRSGQHTNNWKPNFEKALWKTRQSARCEHAGERWLQPIEWNTIDEGGIGKADLGGFIDVKGVEEAHHRLLVQLDAKDAFAYLLVDSWMHPDYAVVGWVWGHEAKLHPVNSLEGEDRPCHCVPRSIPPMRDPHELFEEVRRRE
jgi:hypothetical protein